MTTENTKLTRRYPGIASFTKEQKSIFFGRETDTEKLYDKIRYSDLVVLFSETGLGKTSLLQAGLLPKLDSIKIKKQEEEKERYYPIIVKFSDHSLTPQQIIYKTIFEKVEKLSETEAQKKALNTAFENTLWEFFQKEYAKAEEGIFEGKQVLLIFDQFEELFYQHTSLHRRQVFAYELADLVLQQVPSWVQKRIDRQFHTDEKKIGQVKALETKINLEKSASIKLLISIRADYLSHLHEFSQAIPSILEHRYELKPLTKKQAKLAIEAPAQKDKKIKNSKFESPKFEYDTAFLNKMLDYFGGKIVSFQLQIFCRRIEDEVINREQIINTIDATYLKDNKKSSVINRYLRLLDNFYDDKEFLIKFLEKRYKLYGENIKNIPDGEEEKYKEVRRKLDKTEALTSEETEKIKIVLLEEILTNIQTNYYLNLIEKFRKAANLEKDGKKLQRIRLVIESKLAGDGFKRYYTFEDIRKEINRTDETDKEKRLNINETTLIKWLGELVVQRILQKDKRSRTDYYAISHDSFVKPIYEAGEPQRLQIEADKVLAEKLRKSREKLKRSREKTKKQKQAFISIGVLLILIGFIGYLFLLNDKKNELKNKQKKQKAIILAYQAKSEKDKNIAFRLAEYAYAIDSNAVSYTVLYNNQNLAGIAIDSLIHQTKSRTESYKALTIKRIATKTLFLDNGDIIFQLNEYKYCQDAILSPNQNYIYLIVDNSSLEIYEIKTQKLTQKIQIDNTFIRKIKFSLDDKNLVIWFYNTLSQDIIATYTLDGKKQFSEYHADLSEYIKIKDVFVDIYQSEYFLNIETVDSNYIGFISSEIIINNADKANIPTLSKVYFDNYNILVNSNSVYEYVKRRARATDANVLAQVYLTKGLKIKNIDFFNKFSNYIQVKLDLEEKIISQRECFERSIELHNMIADKDDKYESILARSYATLSTFYLIKSNIKMAYEYAQKSNKIFDKRKLTSNYNLHESKTLVIQALEQELEFLCDISINSTLNGYGQYQKEIELEINNLKSEITTAINEYNINLYEMQFLALLNKQNITDKVNYSKIDYIPLQFYIDLANNKTQSAKLIYEKWKKEKEKKWLKEKVCDKINLLNKYYVYRGDFIDCQ